MDTKQIVWMFFNKTMLKVAETRDTIDFDTLLKLIHLFAHKYDNRTAKNYIDCMMDNGWLVPDIKDNYLDILGKNVITSVYKYRRMKFTINKQAKYDLVNEDEILAKLFK